MYSPWRTEIPWLTWLAFVVFLLGKLTGHYVFAIALGFVVYLARHLYHIDGLLLWLREGGKTPPATGIWEEIYYHIYRIRRRNKRRKKRLIELLERFRTATSALPDATVVLGPRDDIEWFNEAARQLLGLRRDDIGQPIANLLRSPRFAQFLRESDYRQSVTVPAPGLEDRQLEIRVVPYGEDLRLLVAQDTTQIRRMERMRSDFVANVSHELRTPLTVLKGYIETLADQGAVSERHLKVFKSMEEQTQRMQNLVDGLLSLTRLESGHLAPQSEVDIVALLRAICEEATLPDEPKATLNLSLETDARLMGNESELRSAFSNLIFNALKYTQPGDHVEVRWSDDENGVRLEVKDNGPGIPAEHIPRLTERFYRVEMEGAPQKSGAGLGLAIVKHVLNRHDARLKIESKLGKGSCFTCCFPSKRVIRSPLDAKSLMV